MLNFTYFLYFYEKNVYSFYYTSYVFADYQKADFPLVFDESYGHLK